MAKEVTIIPAIKPKYASKATEVGRKRRVAAYARVSTDSDEQFTSFEAQVDYYTKLINARGLGICRGVHGRRHIRHKHQASCRIQSNGKRRSGGKIDLIVTKSIPAGSSAPFITLTTVRQLKKKGVGGLLLKENIYTLDSKGEAC